MSGKEVHGKEPPAGVRNYERVLNRVFYKDHPAAWSMRVVVPKGERCLSIAVHERRDWGPKLKDGDGRG